MIYAKVRLTIGFEMNIPLPEAASIDEANAKIEKEGGKDAFVEAMSNEYVKGMASPFTKAIVTSGTMEIMEV